METIYLICAVVGGTLIVCQFVMTLLGMGGDHDTDSGGVGDASDGHDIGGHDHAADAHHGTNWLFGVLTFRTIVAGLAFFGLTGMALQQTLEPQWILVAAVGAGLLSVFIVAWIMRSLSRLNVDGTVRIRRAMGSRGTVYLSIPGAKGGTGKVHVTVQGRMMEYKAITSHAGLPTGAKIVVVKIVGSDTVEVSPVESLEATSHA